MSLTVVGKIQSLISADILLLRNSILSSYRIHYTVLMILKLDGVTFYSIDIHFEATLTDDL